MLVLGLESTCDETACAVVRNGQEILSNIVASQADLQSVYGGVVPELASRRHIEVLIPVIDQSLHKANVALEEIDLIAVARGPGLIGALLIGLNGGKALSWALGKPFIGVNHVEAHLYAALMSHTEAVQFPCLGVVLSGGHTAMLFVRSIGDYVLIGQTVDDAIGEAFDKTAKILGLPYPGGPQIEKLAAGRDHSRFPLKAGTVKNQPLSFSFSGLKTAVLYASKGQSANSKDPLILNEEEKKDLAASFQYTAFSDVIHKTFKAAAQYQCQTVIFGGGVCCNQKLKTMFQEANPQLTYLWPHRELTLDNAAMIAGLGYHQYLQKGQGDSLELEAKTRIAF